MLKDTRPIHFKPYEPQISSKTAANGSGFRRHVRAQSSISECMEILISAFAVTTRTYAGPGVALAIGQTMMYSILQWEGTNSFPVPLLSPVDAMWAKILMSEAHAPRDPVTPQTLGGSGPQMHGKQDTQSIPRLARCDQPKIPEYLEAGKLESAQVGKPGHEGSVVACLVA